MGIDYSTFGFPRVFVATSPRLISNRHLKTTRANPSPGLRFIPVTLPVPKWGIFRGSHHVVWDIAQVISPSNRDISRS